MSTITLIATDPARFDPQAVDQLRATARFAGIERVVGLPDLHAGNGIAVGAAFWSPDRIWPHLVGSDIGCGMALWELDSLARKFRIGTVERRLRGLDDPWAGDTAAALAGAVLPGHLASPALGTIGGGNHFVELQRIEDIADPERFATLGLREDRVWMMVHSGSRGLGQAILQAHKGQHVNKTDSAVRATHRPSGLVATALEQRSQHANRKLARLKLAIMIEERRGQSRDDAQRSQWAVHQDLERGNPVRVYAGPRFQSRR